MEIFLIVAGRVLASPLVNVFQKKLTNHQISPGLVVTLSYGFFVLISVPCFILLQPFHFPAEFWIYIALLGVVDSLGNYFLVKSLQTIDLSLFGPMNSFKPVFAVAFSAFILVEIPSFVGLVGVAVIIAGSYMLSYQRGVGFTGFGSLVKDKGILFRFLAIALTALAAVFSKKTIVLSSPLITLMYWSVIGFPVTFFLWRNKQKQWKQELSKVLAYKWNLTWLLLCFLALQVFTLLTFQKVFIGYSLALFQLSAVISVLLGRHIFKEKDFAIRLIGSMIMICGTVLIMLWG